MQQDNWQLDFEAIWQSLALEDKDGKRASLERYADMLQAWGAVHNLTGQGAAEQIYLNLLAPSLFVAQRLSGYACVLDLGTGAGVPGLVAAILHPEQQWVLVERAQKKTVFLKRVLHALGLNNVTVVVQDFTQMPVDVSVQAIVSRGSAKLPGQLKLTAAWRAKSIPLFSVQTEKSLAECGGLVQYENLDIPGYFSDMGLMLIQVK